MKNLNLILLFMKRETNHAVTTFGVRANFHALRIISALRRDN